MPRFTYRMTNTAREHLKKAVRDTQRTWGAKQARKYNADFLSGLQYIADNHTTFNSPHREAMAEGTAFSIHLVEHRYVAFQKHDKNTIIIAGIFHETMDIRARLRELQTMVRHEIETLKREIEHTKPSKSEGKKKG
jgi:plasmid stabilization system protein ParE